MPQEHVKYSKSLIFSGVWRTNIFKTIIICAVAKKCYLEKEKKKFHFIQKKLLAGIKKPV